MKHNTKSAISVLLLAASLMTVAMTSCGGDPAGDTKATDAVTGGETAAVTEPTAETRTPHKVDVDALDFGGEELNQAAFYWQGYKCMRASSQLKKH